MPPRRARGSRDVTEMKPFRGEGAHLGGGGGGGGGGVARGPRRLRGGPAAAKVRGGDGGKRTVRQRLPWRGGHGR
eukprot:111299-Prorocentrum_minimum.AAC.1